eukprot:gnl/MRDRNA2_/MRDRNA2_158058_c0_seq1.p1 gnl/MRDRNA2_/MRDRNA2_158058_c0~~gnl/MRDRNA2_/MRDRNA2_158058_c0_seq1.p1  ORF type:complete len:388 (+),score=85.52 gnl/MRDRNA2_/MRDRNA2_158058_c0_seq1:166-1164(+)
MKPSSEDIHAGPASWQITKDDLVNLRVDLKEEVSEEVHKQVAEVVKHVSDEVKQGQAAWQHMMVRKDDLVNLMKDLKREVGEEVQKQVVEAVVASEEVKGRHHPRSQDYSAQLPTPLVASEEVKGSHHAHGQDYSAQLPTPLTVPQGQGFPSQMLFPTRPELPTRPAQAVQTQGPQPQTEGQVFPAAPAPASLMYPQYGQLLPPQLSQGQPYLNQQHQSFPVPPSFTGPPNQRLEGISALLADSHNQAMTAELLANPQAWQNRMTWANLNKEAIEEIENQLPEGSQPSNEEVKELKDGKAAQEQNNAGGQGKQGHSNNRNRRVGGPRRSKGR